MTESFDDAMAFMRKAITDDCDQTYCAMYDDDCYACEGAVLDRLQRAHECEIAEALCDACDQCDRMDKKAHEHEMEQLRRSRFNEGYVAGQRSMDAEHYAVALRLKHLPLDEDSHGNLNQIARAIWHSDFGWTRGACEALRDELVRLLGGVHDEPEPIPASGGACDADCDCGNQQSQTVVYDELGNERHKAVCELRKVPDDIGKSELTYQETEHMIYAALGVEKELLGYYKGLDALRDRLIHLLGGDEPLPNFSEPLPNFSEPNLPKSIEIAKPESEDGGKVTITAELREWASDRHCKGISHTDVLNIGLIADRIDEQFNHAMISRSAELGCYKLRINQLEQERDELQKKLDKVMKEANRHRWEYCGTCEVSKTCDDLRKSLRKIAERVGVKHDLDLSAYDDDTVAKATVQLVGEMHKHIKTLEEKLDTIREALDG